MAIGTRWKLLGAGFFLLVMWFACWAATVVPEARQEQWVASNALAFLAGGAFGAALLVRQANK
jgi:hypothetical protein